MKTQLTVVLALAIAFSCAAQSEKNTLVWVDPSDPHASYLQAAVLRKHTPVSFTTDRSRADLVATLSTDERKGSAARAILIGPAYSGAKENMSLTVSDQKTGNVVFSYTCEKSGDLARMQQAAECLAKHWGNFIEKGKP
jgi:hypothetical protein